MGYLDHWHKSGQSKRLFCAYVWVIVSWQPLLPLLLKSSPFHPPACPWSSLLLCFMTDLFHANLETWQIWVCWFPHMSSGFCGGASCPELWPCEPPTGCNGRLWQFMLHAVHRIKLHVYHDQVISACVAWYTFWYNNSQFSGQMNWLQKIWYACLCLGGDDGRFIKSNIPF